MDSVSEIRLRCVRRLPAICHTSVARLSLMWCRIWGTAATRPTGRAKCSILTISSCLASSQWLSHSMSAAAEFVFAKRKKCRKNNFSSEIALLKYKMVVHEQADEIDKKNWSLNFTPVTQSIPNATQKCAHRKTKQKSKINLRQSN